MNRKFFPILSILFTGALALFLNGPAHGAEDTTKTNKDAPLPDIIARTYPVKVARLSRSVRVYLLADPDDAKPKVGKILLLRREATNTMAFRILKHYPKEKMFAAKRVRTYGKTRVLDVGESYLGIEKLRDASKYSPTPEERAKDLEDIQELEGLEGLDTQQKPLPEVQPFDPGLDSAVTPEDQEEEDDLNDLQVDEVEPFDPDTHWLSAEVAYLRNSSAPAKGSYESPGSSYYTGLGFRYGLTVAKLAFLSEPNAQDSITLEASFYLYKIVEFVDTNDAYTVMPISGIVRYNVMFSKDIGIFGYSGLVQNFVLAQSEGYDEAISVLSSLQLAGGVGLLYRIGPKWRVRVDFGLDIIGAGLVLRF